MRRLILVVVLAACGSDASEPVFPADYAASYVEVRDCRASSDHDLNKIRVLADPAALASYQTRGMPFPDGSIVLKPEYDFADGSCSGDPIQWTVMQKQGNDWFWQKVDARRTVVTENEPRCINCHAACGVAPDGFDGTCAMP